MTMANEMTRLVGDIAAVKSQRLQAVAAIRPALEQQLNVSQTARRAALDSLMMSIKSDMAARRKHLDGISTEAALIRGRSVDMMKSLAKERKEKAAALRRDLDEHAAALNSSVATLLRDNARTREEMAARETELRATFLKDVRGRVRELLLDAEQSISDIAQDRAQAGKVWRGQAQAQAMPVRMEDETASATPAVAAAVTPSPMAESVKTAPAEEPKPAAAGKVDKITQEKPETIAAQKVAPKPLSQRVDKAPAVKTSTTAKKDG